MTAQIAVAWAGEGAGEPRLNWWKSDFISTYGGLDLFHQLLPGTTPWAVLQAAREAARRVDAEKRARDASPDRVISLYFLGFALDERLEERLLDLKRSGREPREALPGLGDLGMELPKWDRARFGTWLERHGGKADATTTPTGRRIAGSTDDLGTLIQTLLAALLPLAESYPLPYAQRTP